MNWLSEVLADYILEYSIEKTGQEVRAHALDCMRDAFGCMVAGVQDQAVMQAREYVACMERENGAQGRALAVGSESGHAMQYAALINGTASNALDYDDISLVMNGHPSSTVLPAALAWVQTHGCTGKEFFESYLLGVETASLLGRGVCPESFVRGWHCTAVLGIFGAVAALGRLRGLTREQLIGALTVTASEACGVKANLGSPVKPFHCGRSAQKAFDIVTLAECGCSGNRDALEAGTGLGSLIASRMDVDAVRSALAKRSTVFLEPGMSLKPWPSCKRTLNGIDAALMLRSEEKIAPKEIRGIVCYVQTEAVGEVQGPMEETEQRKLRLPFCVAAAIHSGAVTLRSFEEELTPELARLLNVIQVVADPELDAKPADTTRIELELEDGRRLHRCVENAKGTLENPMTPGEIRSKYDDCCSGHLSDVQSVQLWEFLTGIEAQPCTDTAAEMLAVAR